jgi:hypothetical protein
MRRLACMTVLGAATTAYADREPVRDDIVDLRHARSPEPLRFLGWTFDGRAVLHEAHYGFQDASCAPEASSSLVVAASNAVSESTGVLAPEVDDGFRWCSDAWPWRVSYTAASRAIRTEAAALASLGSLHPGALAEHPNPTLVHGDCWVHLATGPLGHHKTIGHVFTIGPKACIGNGHDLVVHDAEIVDIHASPDGHALAVTIDVTTLALDSYGAYVETVIVPTPTS